MLQWLPQCIIQPLTDFVTFTVHYFETECLNMLQHLTYYKSTWQSRKVPIKLSLYTVQIKVC